MKIKMSLMIGLLLAPTVSMRADVITSDILTYFSFDTSATAADAGTVSVTATPVSTIGVSTAVKKLGAGSLQTGDTASARLLLTPASSLMSSASDGVYTIVMWAKRDAVSSYSTSEVIYGANNYDHALRVDQVVDPGRDNLSIVGKSDDGLSSFAPTPKSSLLTELDTWRHLGVVYDFDNDEIKVYMNGTQTGSTIGIGGWDGITFDTFALGNHESQSRPFVGHIDDFAVVNGEFSAQQWTDLAAGDDFLAVIPEPATISLMGLSLLALMMGHRFRRK